MEVTDSVDLIWLTYMRCRWYVQVLRICSNETEQIAITPLCRLIDRVMTVSGQ